MKINNLVLTSFVVLLSFSESYSMEYQKPKDELINKLTEQNIIEQKQINRSRSAFAKLTLYTMPSIDYLAKKVIKVAGVKINQKSLSTPSYVKSYKLEIYDFKSAKNKLVVEDKKNNIRAVQWSFDDQYLSYMKEEEKCLSLWVYSTKTQKSAAVSKVCLNGAMPTAYEWISETEILLRARLNKNEVKIEETAPTGPVVLDSNGTVSQNRTYSDLIKTTQDEKVFQDIVKSQYYIYDVKSKTLKSILKPGLWMGMQLSPDRKYIIAAEFKAPYSRRVQYDQFARTVKVFTIKGELLTTLVDDGPYENIPIQGVRKGPRSIVWNPQVNSELIYVEAQDEGDWKNKVEFRDIVFSQKIEKKSVLIKKNIFKVKNRFAGISFFKEPNEFIIHDFERDSEVVTSTYVKMVNDDLKTKVIFSYVENDSYNNPGQFIEEVDNQGQNFLVESQEQQNRFVYTEGEGSTADGDRPFLRKINIENLDIKEIFRSDKSSYESFACFFNKERTQFMTQYQTKEVPPTYKLYNLSGDTVIYQKDLYQEENRFKVLTQIKKELVTYKRNDGLTLSGLLYYPLNYDSKKKYPLIIQAYPLEYVNAQTAGQIRGSQNMYEKPIRDDVIYHALRGYFVLDQAQMPIVGHPETKNDTFIQQLSAGAEAAIDDLNKKNLIDPTRVGVMGHSYGAFMVAHLLTHTKLFSAGVARSGAYNRTLTPFGFQGERRTLWQAKETYLKMSPFLDVDKIKTPILLIHGMKDENSGTFTIQSERYFDALKGMGAKARLVLLPEESHGYVARETNEHVMYEMFNWFDEYVKREGKK